MNNKSSVKASKKTTFEIVIETLTWYKILHIYTKLTNKPLKIKLEKILRKLPKQTWRNISKTKNLTKSFLHKFRYQLDWDVVSKHIIVSKSLLWEFQSFFNLNIVNQRYEIPESIIRKQVNNLNLKQLLKNQQLSEETLTFLLLLDSEREATQTFFQIGMKSYLKLVLWPQVFKYQTISERIITFVHEFRVKHLSKALKTCFWKIILQNKSLTPEIIERFFKTKKVLRMSLDLEQ